MDTNTQYLQIPAIQLLIPSNLNSEHEEIISSVISNIEDPGELSHLEKLKSMHKAVKYLIHKSQTAKTSLKELQQEFENTCECIKIDQEEAKSSNLNELSEISCDKSSSLNDEIKNLESQISLLRDKLKTSQDSLEKRKLGQTEVKKLLNDLDKIHKITSSSKSCECKSCIIC